MTKTHTNGPLRARMCDALRFCTLFLALVLAGACAKPAAPSGDAAPEAANTAEPEADIASAPPLEPEMVQKALEPFHGDYDRMVEMRRVRVLVPFSRTFYNIDGGRQYGVAYDTIVEFEKVVNEKLGDKARYITVAPIPVRRDQMFTYLAEGRGDMAMGNLTITPERLKTVDFADPTLTGVNEIVVTSADAPPVAKLEDLAGREVSVRKSSSYYQHLVAENAKLQAAGLAPITIVPAEEQFEDEDLLEMVNAGIIPTIVVDEHIAKLWANVFAKVVLHPDVVVNSGGEIAIAVRKDAPQLKAVVNEFVATHKIGTMFGNMIYAKYFKDTKWVKNAVSSDELKRLAQVKTYFKESGARYDFDWLLIAAQAYQESGIDQHVHSAAGAVGIMQVLPSTAASPEVGITGVETDPERNIEAGTKYMNWLMTKYFPDAHFDNVNRFLFAFASYNAGPAKVARMRQEAETRGLDPNVWFQNVELIAAQRIGRETVQYVRNIYKYYVAYRLVSEQVANKAAKKTGGG